MKLLNHDLAISWIIHYYTRCSNTNQMGDPDIQHSIQVAGYDPRIV